MRARWLLTPLLLALQACSGTTLGQKLADKVTKAEGTLAKAKSNAMGNLNDVAVEAAIEAIATLTGIKTTSAQAGKVVTSIAIKLSKQEAN